MFWRRFSVPSRIKTPRVTAGLKWPPLILPKKHTIRKYVIPVASGYRDPSSVLSLKLNAKISIADPRASNANTYPLFIYPTDPNIGFCFS